MEITAAEVKRLREKTGAGMMDCKNALAKSEGDFARAERLLKEQGLAAAAKKAGRATGAGLVFVKVLPGKAVVLELSSETDFVARNELFVKLGNDLVDIIAAKNPAQKTPEMDALVTEAISRIKENIEVRRFVTLAARDGETLTDYVHDGRIGVVVKSSVTPAALRDDPRVKQALFDLALHVAAFAPIALSRDKVDPSFLKEQEEIFAKQVEGMDKPANVKQGIAKGKVAKLLAEVCLLDQPFVKDEKRKVSKVLEDLGKEVGGSLAITDFVYYRLGEVR